MKLVVLSKVIKDKQKAMIDAAASKACVDVCYVESEGAIPTDFEDAEILYGLGVNTARTSKNLKWLAVTSAGVDFLLYPDSFANPDCILTNSTGAYGVTIAEHIITVSLFMMRKLVYTYGKTLQHQWSEMQPQKSLKDCRITVLGTGDIGTCFAKRAQAFEPTTIIGLNRSGINRSLGDGITNKGDKCDLTDYFDEIRPISDLDSILPNTDLLVMCLPGTPETENILNKDRIALLPEEAYVVNVGRGNAIDEEALADSLDAGKLAGAALDVFRTEPLPADSRLWTTNNLFITPHVAGNQTLEHTLKRNVELFCENLIRYANGEPLRNQIDRTKGY